MFDRTSTFPLVVLFVWMIALIAFVQPAAGQTSSGPVRTIVELAKMNGQQNLGTISVDVIATVNHWDPDEFQLYVQEADEAIFASIGNCEYQTIPELKTGDVIHIIGVFEPMDYRIDATKVEFIRSGKPVVPLPLQFSTVALGEYWSRFAITKGTVKSTVLSDGQTYLLLDDAGTEFVARIKKPMTDAELVSLIGNDVELTGTIGCEVDPATYAPTRFIVHLMEPESLKSLRTSDQFGYQSTTLADLAQDPPTSEAMPFQVSCQLVHVQDSRLLLEDGETSLAIETSATKLLNRGDLVTVRGTTRKTENGFDRAIHCVHVIGKSDLAPAGIVSARTIVDQNLKDRRISVVGELKSVESAGRHRCLLFESDGVRYSVEFDECDEVFNRLPLALLGTVRSSGWIEESPKPAEHFVVKLASSVDLQILKAQSSVDHQWVMACYILLATAALFFGCACFFKRQVTGKSDELSEMTVRLDSMFEAIRDGILVVDRQGHPERSNKRLGEILGLDDTEFPNTNSVKNSLARLFEYEEGFRSFWQTVENDPGCIRNIVLNTKPANGARSLVIETVPVYDEAEHVMARLWTFSDVTEKQELESRLQQAQKMEAVGRLAGGVAHDFNNLLMVLSGSLELFQRQYAETTPDGAIRLIASAEGATEKAAQLVKQLLGFSRKTALDLRVADLNGVVSSLQTMLKHSIDANVEIRLRLAADLWLAKIDPIQIEQMLLNLCLNARDALPKRGGRITILTENVPKSSLGEAVRITVQDDGIGMSDEVRGKMFEPFFTTKPVGEGTGLGLAMSLGIVDQHNGKIHCESTPGKGSRFEIEIPRTLDTVSIHSFPANGHGDARTVLDSASILLADDEPTVREIAARMLQQLGYDVVTVSDGQAALDMMRIDSGIQLVILDLTMPGVSGFEAFGEISRLYPTIPVIISSGYVCDLDEFTREFQRTPVAVMSKPFRVDELGEQVAAVLKRNSESGQVG